MAHASKKNMGKPDKGKATVRCENRTEGRRPRRKRRPVEQGQGQHSDSRGLDERAVRNEQYQDHAANRRPSK